MRDLTKPKFYVISGERAELSDEANAERTIQLGNMLRALGAVKPSEGMYEGVREASFIVVPEASINNHIKGVLLEISEIFNQDCILEVSAGGEAYLLDYDGGETYLGEARVAATKPLEGQSYTRVGNTYLTIK